MPNDLKKALQDAIEALSKTTQPKKDNPNEPKTSNPQNNPSNPPQSTNPYQK